MSEFAVLRAVSSRILHLLKCLFSVASDGFCVRINSQIILMIPEGGFIGYHPLPLGNVKRQQKKRQTLRRWLECCLGNADEMSGKA